MNQSVRGKGRAFERHEGHSLCLGGTKLAYASTRGGIRIDNGMESQEFETAMWVGDVPVGRDSD